VCLALASPGNFSHSHTAKERTPLKRSIHIHTYIPLILSRSSDENPPAAGDHDDGLVPGQAAGCGRAAGRDRNALRAGAEARGRQAGAGGAAEAGAGLGGGGSSSATGAPAQSKDGSHRGESREEQDVPEPG